MTSFEITNRACNRVSRRSDEFRDLLMGERYFHQVPVFSLLG